MQAIKFAVLDHWADMMVPNYCAEIGPVVPIIARNRGNRLVLRRNICQPILVSCGLMVGQ